MSDPSCVGRRLSFEIRSPERGCRFIIPNFSCVAMRRELCLTRGGVSAQADYAYPDR